MFLIVGLGNPGKKYEHTRHNVGFDTLDKIGSEYNISINRVKFKGELGEGSIAGEKVILLKPLTYMNLSGASVRQVVDYYNIPSNNIIVIYDDVDLEVGRIRIRTKGSSGGHNGIKDIIHNIKTEDFIRLRIGIGKPEIDMVSHVLGRFSKENKKIFDKCLDVTPHVIDTIINEGVQSAMNKFNSFNAGQFNEVNNR